MDDEAIAGLIAPAFETAPAEAPQSPTENGTQPTEAPARDAAGRFVPRAVDAPAAPPAAAQPAPPAQEPAAQAPPAAPEPGHIPITALLEEREKRQGLERRLAEIEAERKASQAQARAADLPPDQQLQGQLWAVRRDISRELIAGKHGEDEAKAIEAWGFEKCERDPAFNSQVYASKNPYEFIRQARQREQLLAEVSPDDLDDYRAWKASRASGGAPAQPAAAAAAQPAPAPAAPTPPRSLVTAPNAGGAGVQTEIAVGPGAAFASTIRR